MSDDWSPTQNVVWYGIMGLMWVFATANDVASALGKILCPSE